MFKFALKFIVLKIDEIQELEEEYQFMLEQVIEAHAELRKKRGKPQNTYLVANTDEPYAPQIAELMEKYGHCAEDGCITVPKPKISPNWLTLPDKEEEAIASCQATSKALRIKLNYPDGRKVELEYDWHTVLSTMLAASKEDEDDG